MKKLLTIFCAVAMVLSVSCVGVAVKEEAVDVAIEVGAFTLGYEGCKSNRDTFKEMAGIAEDGIKLIDADEMTLNELIEDLRDAGAEAISSDPLTQYQVKKLLSLLDIHIDKDAIDIGFAKQEHVRLAVNAFILGVAACK